MERKLILRYAAALVLVAVLAILAFWDIHSLAALQEESSGIIDLAAGQQVLAQRMAVAAAQHELAADPGLRERLAADLARDAEQLRNTHERLSAALAGENRLPGPFTGGSEALRAIYQKPPLHLDRQVRLFLQAAREILGETDPARRHTLTEGLLTAARGPLAEALRAAARQYQAEAVQQSAVLRSAGLGLILLVLAVLLFEMAQIFRPLLHRMVEARRQMRELACEAEEASACDRLTGLYHRVKLTEFLEREMSSSRRYATPLSLLLLDVDRFSQINATYGHETGDRLLAELALLIKNNLRLSDLAFRFDGATFAILAPQTSAEGAAVIGDKLRRLVKGYSFGRKPLTASLGAATLAGDDDREQLLSRALRALQQAKTNGRDCLVLEPA